MFSSRKKILGFDDRWMMLFGVPIVGLMVNAILFGHLIQKGLLHTFGMCQFVALGYTLVYWLIFREIHFYFVKKYQGYDETVKRFVRFVPTVLITFFIVKALMHFTIDTKIHEILEGNMEPHEITEVVSSFLLLVLILTIYETKYLAYQLRISQIEKEQLIKENISSQLEGLRSQVNPHFLFNSLNTLSAIIPENPDKAVSFVSKMSKVYRYILEIKDKKIIPLREELKFLDSYTFLLKERFGNNINISISVQDDQLDRLIVPLSLQITFENAIKHNIISKEKPLHIEVFIEDGNKLIVKNNLQKKNVTSSSTQFGLKNIKNRYKFFTDISVDVISTVEHFIISLPLLNNHA